MLENRRSNVWFQECEQSSTENHWTLQKKCNTWEHKKVRVIHWFNMLNKVTVKTENQWTTTIVLWPFVQDYLGEPVPEETFPHSHLSWSSTILYQLSPSITIHSILPVQFTCLTVFFHNLSPSPLWSTSRSGTLQFILHTFLHPIIVLQHIPIPLKCQLKTDMIFSLP